MTNLTIMVILLFALVLVTSVMLFLAYDRKKFKSRITNLSKDLIDVSADVSLGRRLDEQGVGSLNDLAKTINRLFDAIVDRDEEIQDRDQLFMDFTKTLPEIVLLHDEQIILTNDSTANLVGLDAKELIGRDPADLVKPAYRALFRKSMSAYMNGEVSSGHLEIQLINGHDGGLWVEMQSSIIEHHGQKVILTIARDVSYRKNLEASLSRSKRQAQYTLESISEAILTTDNDGRIDYINHATEKIIGIKREKVAGKKTDEIFKLVDETDRRSLGDPVDRCISIKRRVNMGRRALLISLNNSKEYSVEVTASPILGPTKSFSGTVVVIHDVSEIRGLTRQISYQAAHDALTGLINRREFERQLEEAIDVAHSKAALHVMAYLDLDWFKAVNDSCGHIAGDNVLREVASLIREQVRDSDYVGRLGGDEFGTLLIGCPLDKAQQIATDICNAIGKYRFVWQDKIFNIGISVGLVEVSHKSGSSQDVLAAADSACYIAKQRGRGQVHIYSAKDEVIARERGDIQWLPQLQNALRDNKFELALQPIIATSGTSTGPALEVLIRLPGQDGQSRNSADFLRSAERYNLMPKIDRWVINAVQNAMSSGDIKIPKTRSCAINISGQTLSDETFLSFVVESLDNSGISPSSICFEVTENAISSNLEYAQRFIEVLHGIGCEFALDDFGRGLGAFSSLKNLPIDYLKIDGAYTSNLASDQVNQEMVVAMIKLARTMEFRVVAEQVEEQEDFDWLRMAGIDFVQGNFVDMPVPLGKVPISNDLSRVIKPH